MIAQETVYRCDFCDNVQKVNASGATLPPVPMPDGWLWVGVSVGNRVPPTALLLCDLHDPAIVGDTIVGRVVSTPFLKIPPVTPTPVIETDPWEPDTTVKPGATAASGAALPADAPVVVAPVDAPAPDAPVTP